jgi:hypothetical protein
VENENDQEQASDRRGGGRLRHRGHGNRHGTGEEVARDIDGFIRSDSRSIRTIEREEARGRADGERLGILEKREQRHAGIEQRAEPGGSGQVLDRVISGKKTAERYDRYVGIGPVGDRITIMKHPRRSVDGRRNDKLSSSGTDGAEREQQQPGDIFSCVHRGEQRVEQPGASAEFHH